VLKNPNASFLKRGTGSLMLEVRNEEGEPPTPNKRIPHHNAFSRLYPGWRTYTSLSHKKEGFQRGEGASFAEGRRF